MGQQKDDIVCAFHYDLEKLTEDISKKLDDLRLFNAKVVGGFVVLNVCSIVVLKLIKVL